MKNNRRFSFDDSILAIELVEKEEALHVLGGAPGDETVDGGWLEEVEIDGGSPPSGSSGGGDGSSDWVSGGGGNYGPPSGGGGGGGVGAPSSGNPGGGNDGYYDPNVPDYGEGIVEPQEPIVDLSGLQDIAYHINLPEVVVTATVSVSHAYGNTLTQALTWLSNTTGVAISQADVSAYYMKVKLPKGITNTGGVLSALSTIGHAIDFAETYNFSSGGKAALGLTATIAGFTPGGQPIAFVAGVGLFIWELVDEMD